MTGQNQNSDDRPFHSRQRQQKGKKLVSLHARIAPVTYAWLRQLAGDSSLGIALDELHKELTGEK